MRDEDKSKEQLIKELAELRHGLRTTDTCHSESREISNPARDEALLRHSRDRWEAMLKVLPVGVAIAEDPEGNHIAVNQTLAEMLGMSVDHNASLAVPEGRAAYCAFQGDRELQVEDLPMQQAIRGVPVANMEMNVLRADGKRVSLQASAVPLKDANGHWQGAVGAFLDVTERRRAEHALLEANKNLEQRVAERTAALRESEQRLRLAIEATGCGTYTYDFISGQGRWSPELKMLYGLGSDEPLPLDADNVPVALYPDDRSSFLSGMTAANEPAGNGIFRLDFRVVQPDRSLRWLRVDGRTEFNGEGAGRRPSRAAGIVIDITERKKAEEEHRRLQQKAAHAERLLMMNEMVAGIAHLVNQPLCSILNFAKACCNVLIQEDPKLALVCDWNKRIAAEAARAGDIIRQLQDFVHRSEDRRLPARIREIVEDATSFIAFHTDRQKVVVLRQFADAEPIVNVESIQIRKVLLGLMWNACEALDKKAEGTKQITIRIRLTGQFVEVSVADNGPGLVGIELSQLFQSFVTTKPQGAGMGLAISRSIVEAHGGRIWAGANPGGGITFHFTLPIAGIAGQSDAC